MTSNRKRIIPHKRGLLPISSSSPKSVSTSTPSSSSAKTIVHKTINPSAVPAIIQLQRPVFSSLKETTTEREHEDRKSGKGRYTTGLDDDENRNRVIRIEFDSSQAPQPFLEPERLQKIMEARRHRKSYEHDDDEGEATEENTATVATEREVRRRAAQTDYGSMAIRDRMNISGKGRRGSRR